MNGLQQFFEAVESGDTAALAGLLDRAPALVNSRSATGLSPVLSASYRGHEAAVALLRERGAELDVFDAAVLGDIAALGAILARAPEAVHTRSADGWTPLHLAAFFGRPAAAALLLDAGTDVRAWSDNSTRNTPLHAALAGACDPLLVAALLDAGADVNAIGEGGVTPLHLAAARGNVALIDALLARGADAVATAGGKAAVDFAVERGHAEAAERLRREVH